MSRGVPLGEIKDLSVIDLMSDAGCYSLSIGIETFNRDLLQYVKRNQSFDLLEAIVQRCRKNGIEVVCHLMMGFPTQTKKQILSDVKRACSLPFSFIHFNIFMALNSLCSSEKTKVPYSELKAIQRWSYARLIFKFSVIKFVFSRFLFNKRLDKIIVKCIKYFLQKDYVFSQT